MKKQVKEIVGFLNLNGFTEILEPVVSEIDSDISYSNDSVQIDIDEDEIVLIGDKGDFCHIPINFFALIGALIHYRLIPSNYKHN